MHFPIKKVRVMFTKKDLILWKQNLNMQEKNWKKKKQ